MKLSTAVTCFSDTPSAELRSRPAIPASRTEPIGTAQCVVSAKGGEQVFQSKPKLLGNYRSHGNQLWLSQGFAGIIRFLITKSMNTQHILSIFKTGAETTLWSLAWTVAERTTALQKLLCPRVQCCCRGREEGESWGREWRVTPLV